VDLSNRLPELAQRGVARLWIEDSRREGAASDVFAQYGASRLVVVNHSRRDAGVSGAPLELEALAPPRGPPSGAILRTYTRAAAWTRNTPAPESPPGSLVIKVVGPRSWSGKHASRVMTPA
jgi:hypothetical protein